MCKTISLRCRGFLLVNYIYIYKLDKTIRLNFMIHVYRYSVYIKHNNKLIL